MKKFTKGTKFGKLTIIKSAGRVSHYSYPMSSYECECECGKKVTMLYTALTQGHCGCSPEYYLPRSPTSKKFVDISGQTYGALNVLKFIGFGKNGSSKFARYLCQCLI